MNEKSKEVGYGKPPKHSQFKKGKSGNPKGRPAGKKNFATYLDTMLKSKVPISENGKTRKITTVEASLARLREKALKGDPRSLEKLLDYAERYALEQSAKDEDRKLSSEDQAIFEAYEARLRLEGGQLSQENSEKKK